MYKNKYKNCMIICFLMTVFIVVSMNSVVANATVDLISPNNNSDIYSPIEFKYKPITHDEDINYTELNLYKSEVVTENVSTDTESEWNQGTFTDTTTDGDGDLVLGETIITSGQSDNEGSLSNDEWHTVSLDSSIYDTTPLVFATTQTTNGGQDPSLAHVRSVSQSSFETQHCEYDSWSCDGHNDETNAWVAIDPSKIQEVPGMDAGTIEMSNADTVFAGFEHEFENPPIVFTQVQTNNGALPINSKIFYTYTIGVDILLCEQNSQDLCNDNHATETVAWWAIDPELAKKYDIFDWGTVSVTDSNWESISFSQSYSNTPGVIVETQSRENEEDLISEADNVNTEGADVRYCEAEGDDSCDTHTTEGVAWLSVKHGTLETSSLKSSGTYKSKSYGITNNTGLNTTSIKYNTPDGTSISFDYAVSDDNSSWVYYDSYPLGDDSNYMKFNTTLQTNGLYNPSVDYINLTYNSVRNTMVDTKSNYSNIIANETNTIEYDFRKLYKERDTQSLWWNIKLALDSGYHTFAENDRTFNVTVPKLSSTLKLKDSSLTLKDSGEIKI